MGKNLKKMEEIQLIRTPPRPESQPIYVQQPTQNISQPIYVQQPTQNISQYKVESCNECIGKPEPTDITKYYDWILENPNCATESDLTFDKEYDDEDCSENSAIRNPIGCPVIPTLLLSLIVLIVTIIYIHRINVTPDRRIIHPDVKNMAIVGVFLYIAILTVIFCLLIYAASQACRSRLMMWIGIFFYILFLWFTAGLIAGEILGIRFIYGYKQPQPRLMNLTTVM